MADSRPIGDKCPLCQELGRNGTLELRQINAYDALWICGNSKCPYPVHLGVPTVPNLLPELLEPPTPPQSPLATRTGPQTTAEPMCTTSGPNGPTSDHLQSNGTNPIPDTSLLPLSSTGHFNSSFSATSSANFSSFYPSPSLPQGGGFSAANSIGPAPPIPFGAHGYPPMEYKSLQEEFDALFEDNVTELFGDTPQTQGGHHY